MASPRPRGITTTGGHFEILARDQTTWLPLVLSPRVNRNGETVPGSLSSISEVLESAESDARVTPRVKVVRLEDFSGGAGVSYNAAPGVYARNDFALPAGAATDVDILAANNSNSPIRAIAEFGGDIWFAQQGDGTANTARVIRSVGGTSALTSTGLNLGAGEYIQDLLVADDGTGTLQTLWASSSNSATGNGLDGRMHRWNPGTSNWTSTAASLFGAGNGRNRMKSVLWTGNDGVGGPRIVTVSGPGQIAYTKPYADPLLAVSWVEGVRIGAQAGLYSIAAARRHVWFGSGDNLFDTNELGDSIALTTGLLQHAFTGRFSEYLSDYVYVSEGTGLRRVYVGQAGVLQEVPGHCAPGQFTRAENEFRGPTTCLITDQGFLVNAVRNDSTARAAIWWGIDRSVPGIDTPNPLVWYGPEVVSANDKVVSAMRIVFTSNGLRLWIGSVAGSAPSTPHLAWISIPAAGTPLQDLVSGGVHRFAKGDGVGTWNAESYLQLLKQGGDDRVSNKLIHSYGSIARGLDVATGTALRHKARADVAPGTTTWTETQNVTANSTELIPLTVGGVYEGRQIEERYDFLSPSGTATPPKVGVLDACRIGFWEATPQTRARTIHCESDTTSALSPDTVTDELIRLTTYYRTTVRERSNKRWTAKIIQSLKIDETVESISNGNPYGKRIEYELEVDFLAEL